MCLNTDQTTLTYYCYQVIFEIYDLSKIKKTLTVGQKKIVHGHFLLFHALILVTYSIVKSIGRQNIE